MISPALHISAAPHAPNTFWRGQSGRYYRNYQHAKFDNPALALNPDDYRIDNIEKMITLATLPSILPPPPVDEAEDGNVPAKPATGKKKILIVGVVLVVVVVVLLMIKKRK